MQLQADKKDNLVGSVLKPSELTAF